MECPEKMRQYVIANYLNGNNYGLYILQLYSLIYNAIGFEKSFNYDTVYSLLDDYVLGPRDLPFRKFDYIKELIKMEALVKDGEKYRLSKCFLQYVNNDDRFKVRKRNRIYIVRVAFNEKMKKGIAYMSTKNHSPGEIVYVTGTRSGIKGKVISVEKGYKPSYRMESIIDD